MDRESLCLKNLGVEDLERLSILESESFKTPWSLEDLKGIFKNSMYKFRGIFREDELAGYYILMDSVDVYELARIAVSINYRGRGYSKLLMEDMIEDSDKNIFLEVREGNSSAISLYSKFRFIKVGQRKAYYRDTGEDAVVMMLEK